METNTLENCTESAQKKSLEQPIDILPYHIELLFKMQYLNFKSEQSPSECDIEKNSTTIIKQITDNQSQIVRIVNTYEDCKLCPRKILSYMPTAREEEVCKDWTKLGRTAPIFREYIFRNNEKPLTSRLLFEGIKNIYKSYLSDAKLNSITLKGWTENFFHRPHDFI
jgi:hypothetical protein